MKTEIKTAETNSIAATLAERGKRYGSFDEHARYTQRIKDIMVVTPNWKVMTDSQRESLDMIAHKLGRILNGDPNYADSWHDIAGYAALVEAELNR